MADQSQEPVPPRDAATVLIARPGPEGAPHLYMVLRSARSPFMPGTLVFPGGRVDADDGGAGTDAAFERAARRETLEEIGVELGTRSLHWFDTWITPSAEPRRYHAKFFAVSLDRDEAEHARADGHETHDGRWASVADHLAAWEREEVDLPPPTLATLLRLRDVTFGALRPTLGALDPREPILPKWISGDDGDAVVLPHDPGYADLPGLAGPIPRRVRTLPRRFLRSDRRWLPTLPD